MSRSLSGFTVSAKLKALLSNTLDGAERVAQVYQGIEETVTFANGTSSSQFDQIWQDSDRTISSGGTEDIDLFDLGSLDIGAGAGKDAVGLAWATVEIVGLLIVVESASAGSLIVGGNGTGAAFNSLFNASDTAQLGPIGPNGVFFVANPANPAFAVADTTNHLLRLTATGGDVTYSIAIAGRSA